MENNEWKTRTRINYKCNAKGIIQPDVTIEVFDMSNGDALELSKNLLLGALFVASGSSKKGDLEDGKN